MLLKAVTAAREGGRMPIEGAIFDCDGTLLDSMPMWSDACIGLLERYGVRDARRIFADHESLDMYQKCSWYHDNLGIGPSGEHLYRELWADVERAYANRVRPFAGCRDFLERLAAQGVPMVIASATPTALLESALEAHGLRRYFNELIFAGDVGRGKEHPDVYLASCERLGTARSRTWVFEDAPFGVRSAVRAGFPTVAVANDHDGRDVGFLKRWATLVSWGYEGLTPQTLDSMGPRVLRALVVAGSPELSSSSLVRSLCAESDFVVAADAGARALMGADAPPDVFCGDQDSADDEACAWACAASARVERYPSEKDDTDLGLAVSCARREAEDRGAALRLTLTCASGGRPDHMLGVWGVLARTASASPRLVEDGFECRVLSREGTPCWTLADCVGATVSLVALSPHSVVSASGMRWNLDHARFQALDDLGVSNRVAAADACVRCHEGVLAAIRINE